MHPSIHISTLSILSFLCIFYINLILPSLILSDLTSSNLILSNSSSHTNVSSLSAQCIYVSMSLSIYLPTYLSMYACMHVLYLSLFLVVCLSVCLMSFLFFISLFFLYLWVCLCWVTVHFEQALSKWPEEPVVYSNKGSPGHLLQHENNSTGLHKRRLINLKPSRLLQYFSWSICLVHVYLSCVLSICPSIYLHYSTVLIIPLQVDLSLFPLSSFHLFDFLSF